MAKAIVKFTNKPKRHAWIYWFKARVMRQNKNNLVSIVGGTGSGKSYSGISIGEIMSDWIGVPFTIDNIVFSLKELMNLVNSGTLKKGSVIVADEFQCSISAREFQSEANKVFNYLLSTFRHLNLTLIFCTPFETLLDKNARRLFHVRMETMSINHNNKTCRLKPRYLEHVDFKNEPYRKQLIIQYKEDERTKYTKVFHWDLPKPRLAEAYEIKKKAFTSRLNKNITERLTEFDLSGKSITADIIEEQKDRKPLTETQERVMKVLANVKGTNKYEIARQELGISLSTIHQNKTLAEKKGYKVEEFKENDD